MKKIIFTLAAILVYGRNAMGHGVAIKNAGAAICLRLNSTSQVVTITTRWPGCGWNG